MDKQIEVKAPTVVRAHERRQRPRLGRPAMTLLHERLPDRNDATLGLGKQFRDRRTRLALLLIRVVENATEDTWRNIRHELDRVHLVTLATPDGHVAQRSTTTPAQTTILTALGLTEPPRFFDFTVPSD